MKSIKKIPLILAILLTFEVGVARTNPGLYERHCQKDQSLLLKGYNDEMHSWAQNVLFERLKSVMVKYVDGLNVKQSIKISWIQRLQEIKWKPGICEIPAHGIEAEVGGAIEARFHSRSWAPEDTNKFGQIEVCKGFFSAHRTSLSVAFILAHEFAHSIDPCAFEVQKAWQNELRFEDYPLQKVLQCLRSDKSIKAQKLGDQSICQGDQINEAFADWLATEVVVLYQKIYPNDLSKDWETVLDHPQSCHKLAGKVTLHPKVMDRYDKLIGAHTALKSISHSKSDYCSASVYQQKSKVKSRP